MTTLNQLKAILKRLSTAGWADLFSAHGLDILAKDLEAELEKDISASINRKLPGFTDFSWEGKQGIAPGIPAHSLVFHALASPAVLLNDKGKPLTAFPTMSELEIVENYVYASARRSISDIINSIPGNPNFAIAVFAYEYRTSKRTVHGKHADICFSRTGIGRVGNSDAIYVPEARGFKSFVKGDSESTIRVSPVRYGAFIAVQLKGDENNFGPARFNVGQALMQADQPDENVDFWVPLHKLYDGEDCLSDSVTTVDFDHKHTNEKLRRIHLQHMGISKGFDSGHTEPEIDSKPFIFHTDIAERSTSADLGSCVMVPVVHASIVSGVEMAKQKITVNVPPAPSNTWSPTYNIVASDNGARTAPEYVHVRYQVNPDGSVSMLNDQPNVISIVARGKYKAWHNFDFTGDGWITANCKQINNKIPRNVPAYSIIAACDFFPAVDQAEVMDWWSNVVPSSIKKSIWFQAQPLALCDGRTPPNLDLQEVDFRLEDVSVTAIVSQFTPMSLQQRKGTSGVDLPDRRNSILPDGAAGVFAPGWDTSLGLDKSGNLHLAAYGLGSPFPEDAKLCAALSSFWPAAAPDSSRQYPPTVTGENRGFPTVCPLTDAEIGLTGSLSWDGNMGPVLVTSGGISVVEYTRFEFVDFTDNVKQNRVSIAKTSLIDIDEYTTRILGMNRVYQSIGSAANKEKTTWGILSFTRVDIQDAEVKDAISAGFSISGSILKFHMFQGGRSIDHPSDFKKIHITIARDLICLYEGLPEVLIKENKIWKKVKVK